MAIMIKITGKFVRVPKAPHPCPQDGVHRQNSLGYIRGAHAYMVDDALLVPFGLIGFYWQMGAGQGVKVYYSLKKRKKTRPGDVEKIFHVMKKIWKKTQINPEPIEISDVHIKIECDGSVIDTITRGIVTKACQYPEKAWYDYACGKPYDWAAVQEENHNPKSFCEFQQKAKKIIKKYKLTTKAKLGDVVYDMASKRWFLVDCDTI